MYDHQSDWTDAYVGSQTRKDHLREIWTTMVRAKWLQAVMYLTFLEESLLEPLRFGNPSGPCTGSPQRGNWESSWSDA